MENGRMCFVFAAEKDDPKVIANQVIVPVELVLPREGQPVRPGEVGAVLIKEEEWEQMFPGTGDLTKLGEGKDPPASE